MNHKTDRGDSTSSSLFSVTPRKRICISYALALFITVLALCPTVQGQVQVQVQVNNSIYENYNAQLELLYLHGIIDIETVKLLWLGDKPSTVLIVHDVAVLNYFLLEFETGNRASTGASHLERAANSTTTGTYTLSSSTPAIPFVGNRMVVIGAVPFANNTNLSAVALRRQGDCSLVEDVFEPVNNLLVPASVAELPGAQDYLHTLSGLTTTPDVFPEGCITDPTYGVSAVTTVEPVGVTANGLNLVAQLSGNGLTVNEINTSSNATSTITLSTSTSIYAMVVADVNGDGLNDIVASGVTDPATSQPSFAIFLNNGDGTFKAATYADAPATVAFTVDDVNKDGKPDIVFNEVQYSADGAISADYITTLLGKGDGTFQAGVNTPISTGGGGAGPITGDFNGDGKKDVLFGSLVLLGNGDGTFAAGPALPAALQYFAGVATAAAVGDFNKDGKLDVVYSSGGAGSGSVQIMLGNGDGSFQVGRRYASLTPGQQVTVTDIDGDGNPDIVVGNSSQGLYVQDSNDNLAPMFQILLGRGDGTFVGAPTYFGQGSIYQNVSQLATGDFSGDGKADVLTIEQVTSNGNTVPVLAMLPGDGSGNLGGAVTSPINLTPTSLVAAKMYADTALDVVLAGRSTGGLSILSVLRNQGNGTFAGEQDYSLPAGATSLAVGDFNGDGIMDVAVGVSTGSSGTSGVYVLLGQANGTLATPVQIDTSVNPVSIAAGDLTGAGRADLIIADQGTNAPGATNGVNGALHVYLGNANGTFTGAAAPTTTAGVYSLVAIGDLNNDGKPDLIIGGGASGATDAPNVYTMLGNGDGTFQAAQVTALLGTDDAYPNSVSVADFSGDGKLDVIVGGPSDFTEVLLGNGDGTFAQGLMALAQQPTVLSAVDLSGSGLSDLLVGSNSGLAVFLNVAQWAAVTGPASTTTTLSASPNPAITGQSVTLAAAVASTTAGTPTGTVSFLDGTTVLGNSALTAQGTATFSSTTLTAGTHSLTAQYSGDGTFAASTSSAVSLVVSAASKASTSAALTSSQNPSTFGQSVTFTVTVSSQTAGTPTGTATFFDGNTQLGAPIVLNGSAASQYTTSSLSTGSHSITAQYSGDSNYATCTSTAVTQVVNASTKAATTTAVSASSNPSTSGTTVTFTATVSSATAGTITGTVTFLDGPTSMGMGTIAGGMASYSTSTLAVGIHSITAQYGGDANFSASTSSALSLTVSAPAANFTLSASPASITVTRHMPGTTTITVTPGDELDRRLRNARRSADDEPSIQFSCANLPADVTCQFSQATVTLNGSPMTTQLTVSENATGSAMRIENLAAPRTQIENFAARAKNLLLRPRLVFSFALFAGLLILAAFGRRSLTISKRRAVGLAVACCLLLVTLASAIGGCAGSPETPTASTIIIQANANGQNVQLPLIVILQK
jgi:Bacterial Ig-like domain (group 3)/FG-GAP-like repeat